jgi:hypothetical protein
MEQAVGKHRNEGRPDHVQFALPPERWEAFYAALDAPARIIPALKELLTEEGVFDGHGGADGRQPRGGIEAGPIGE